MAAPSAGVFGDCAARIKFRRTPDRNLLMDNVGCPWGIEVLLLKEHYNNRDYCCHLCQAGRGPGLELTRFSITAAHRASRLSSRAWYAKYCAAGVMLMCPLLLIPGFCIWKCMYDVMHTLDLGL